MLPTQRRAELAAQLVRACGPPAALLGRSIVDLLLALAAAVSDLRYAPTAHSAPAYCDAWCF
jgi:hypothetical protein